MTGSPPKLDYSEQVIQANRKDDVVAEILKLFGRYFFASVVGFMFALSLFCFAMGTWPYVGVMARGAVGIVAVVIVVLFLAIILPDFRKCWWAHWVIGLFSWTPLVVYPIILSTL
jgi:hypothetical protein